MDSWRFPSTEGAEECNYVNYEIYDLAKKSLALLEERVREVVAPFVQGYVWQRDAWNVTSSEERLPPRRKGGEGMQECLWGHQRFGDSVDEEWFVISLLVKITECLPSVVAKVWDNDGEVLLIEAAVRLPKWIKPETSLNRVWLRHGKLHIIPRHFPDPNVTLELTLDTALDFLHTNEHRSMAKEKIQAAIKARLGDFLNDASQTQHCARCFLPVRVGHVLEELPLVVSAAVEVFVDREGADMQALRHPALFPPVDFVMCMVKFHRCSYAKLKQSEFHPPSGYQLPDREDPNFNAADIGMKLACGMEMLCRKLKKERSQSGELIPVDMTDKLLHVLEAKGTVSAEVFRERHHLWAEDDESWLYDGRHVLEEELAKREAEEHHTAPSQSNPNFNPEDLVHSFDAFVDHLSSHEGAEAPPDVQFNTRRFMHELKATLGHDFQDAFTNLHLSDDSLSSSQTEDDLSDPSLSLGSSNEVRISQEPPTSSDSDDDSDFQTAYDAALQSELDQTKLPQSFIQKSTDPSSLPEVDLDTNLVHNLLQSHSDQHGLPGPVSSLASLLHVTLPPSSPPHDP